MPIIAIVNASGVSARMVLSTTASAPRVEARKDKPQRAVEHPAASSRLRNFKVLQSVLQSREPGQRALDFRG